MSIFAQFWLESIKISTILIKVSTPFTPPKLIVFSRIFIYNLSRYRINSCLFRISLEESDSDVLEGEIMRTRKKRKQNIIEIDEMQTTQQEFTN